METEASNNVIKSQRSNASDSERAVKEWKQISDTEVFYAGNEIPEPTEYKTGQSIQGELRPAPRQVSEVEFKNLRRMYFTVRHDTVQPCQHKLDRINQPKNNCEYCWFGFYESHPDLVETADKAYITHGKDFLDKLRGVKFRKYFLRYMATKLKLQQEQEIKECKEDLAI